jgi:hypothetical protein
MDGLHTLRARLADLRRLVRLAALGAGLGRLLLRLALLAAASFALDRAFELPPTARLVLLGLAGARLVLRPLAQHMPDAALALEVEERLPQSGDVLASALAFGPQGGGSAALQALVLGRAEQVARSLRPGEFVRWQTARRRLAAGLLAVVVLAGAALARPAEAGLWFRRDVLLERVEWPRATALALIDFPGPVRYVPRGADVDLRVRAAGRVPRVARLMLTDVRTGASRSLDMARAGSGQFTARVAALDATSTFSVQAGDGRLPEHRLEVVDRPAVAAARMQVTPPAYISPHPIDLAWNSDTFDVPAGSRVSIALQATQPLSAAVCRLDGGPPQPMQQSGPSTASTAFDAAHDVSCEFSLTDTFGIGMAAPLRVEVRAVPDRPPAVHLTGSGVGDMVVATARVPVHVSATDDYGVTAVQLLRRYEGEGPAKDFPPIDLPQGAGGTEFSADRVVELSGLDLAPGGRLVLSATATDDRQPPPPNTASSPALSFRVVTVQELLSALLVRQQDLRRDLEAEMDRGRRLAALSTAGLRSGAHVAELTASGYRAVLEQMLNNGVIAQAAFDRHIAEIVTPLETLAAAMERGPVTDSLARMDAVRSRMMLLESYAGLVASVKEVTAAQQRVLEGTQQLEQNVLDLIGK